MNYYYDIILNWNEEESYNFYEWNDTDYLELIKKIPLFKVKHKIFLDLVSNNIQISSDFLELIKDKTLISTQNNFNKIPYACLFTDNKNVIALEFNSKGQTTSRSNLTIDDELNVLEISYALKDQFITYDIIKSLPKKTSMRQEKEAKKLITLEINNLYQNKEEAKLKYLYYEYKKEKIDKDLIYQKIMQDLKGEFNEEILKLYYIIKLSYHNV